VRSSAEDRSGSNGGLGLQVRLPIPGQQVDDFVGGIVGEPGQHVCKPGLRVDIVDLTGFDEGVDGGGAMATITAIGESSVDIGNFAVRAPSSVTTTAAGIAAGTGTAATGR